MNYFPLTKSQQEWQERVADLASKQIGPKAAEYDAKSEYPRESLDALKDAGLWALRVLSRPRIFLSWRSAPSLLFTWCTDRLLYNR